jgi:hypothetical protein
VIKRIRFAARAPGVSAETFAADWPAAAAAATRAPSDARPARVAVCLTLPSLTGTGSRHSGVAIEWFADAGQLERFARWPGGEDPAAGLADPADSPVVLTEESVVRGADWLEQRWRDGGEKFKHMAMAVRDAGLTREEFSARWRAHAGAVPGPGSGTGVVIPADLRGHAYVQNHPCPGEWAYDAVNEVYFDDLAGLRARIEWFARTGPPPVGNGLFGQSWFIAAREIVLA